MKYKFNGSLKKLGISANELASILKHESKRHGGTLNIHRLLKDAKSPKHPLHNYFEWDDKVAAEQHRLQQARELIALLMVIENEREHRAFMNVWFDEQGDTTLNRNQVAESVYMDYVDVFNDDKFRKHALERAIREMLAFENKYEMLEELNDVFSAMKKAKKKIQRGLVVQPKQEAVWHS